MSPPLFPYPDAKAGNRGTGYLAGYLAPKGILAAWGPAGTARCPGSTAIQGLLCLYFESKRMGEIKVGRDFSDVNVLFKCEFALGWLSPSRN